MRKWYVTSISALLVAAGTTILSSSAGADRMQFGALPAAANIAALSSTPMATNPSVVDRLPQDIRPQGRVHALGRAGFAWTRPDGSVCVAMTNYAGTCFSTFDVPVVLFLSGRILHGGDYAGTQQLTGVVPDSVSQVVLVTSTGKSIPTRIVENSFVTELAAGEGITGETITLADGTTFFHEDVLMPAREVPARR
jgi:hypothetical protein